MSRGDDQRVADILEAAEELALVVAVGRQVFAEILYGNMPTMGLAAVTGAVPAASRAHSARGRITGHESVQPVDPY